MWSKSHKGIEGAAEREWLFSQHSALEAVEGYLTRVVNSGRFELQAAAHHDGQDLGNSESGD